MQTARTMKHNRLKVILWSGALALLCGVWSQPAQARVTGLFIDYTDYANHPENQWVEKTIDGNKTNLVWKSGYEPTDDKDGDGIKNIDEFNGWQATINGFTGWFTYNAAKVGGSETNANFFGYGPDIELFDTDCDGISDLYESDKMRIYAKTNPDTDDTDGDGLKDPVEIYAGLDPKDDGYVYTNYANKNGVVTGDKYKDPYLLMAGVTTDVTTLQFPGADIDGDGLTSKQELKKANKDINFAEGCPPLGSTRDHFPTVKLDEKSWTSPFDCDTDNDWKLDSFEKFYAKGGFNAISNEPPGDDFHWDSDPDKDGLSNHREQCMHPLLSYGWVPGPPWPTVPFDYGPCALAQKEVTSAGRRFKEPGRGGCLHGTVGYLQQAQYSKWGDSARYFVVDYSKTNWLATISNSVKVGASPANPKLQSFPGSITWPAAASYWTEPRPQINVRGWDTDGDLLPDGWEADHGLNPLTGMSAFDLGAEEDEDDGLVGVGLVSSAVTLNPSGTLGDPDADKLLNLEEYYGQDGNRIDYRTGTGDETVPWIIRALNYHNQSTFEDYLHNDPLHGVYFFQARHFWQAPNYFGGFSPCLAFSLDQGYAASNYPGFFHPSAMTTSVTNWLQALVVVTNAGPPVEVVTNLLFGPVVTNKLVPTVGVPSFPYDANDMVELAAFYGGDFLPLSALIPQLGTGGFQPFATSLSGLYYLDVNGDRRYTPGLDNLWYSTVEEGVYTPPVPPLPGDVILSDPDGALAAAMGPISGGRPVTENVPKMIPMPGWDTDSDGLSDAMEIQMDVARGKQPTSPVQAQSPLVARSAKIVTDDGTEPLFVDYPFYFARDFTIETWVYLEGETPASGSFIKGYSPWPPANPTTERKAYDLGVTNVTINGQVVSTVAYAGMHTLGGKWYQASATRPLPRNRWVHLAATFEHEKNALSLYMDGTLVQSRQVVEETFGNYLLQS